ncbi:unnamed protein product [Scytosiphon promiscuus]
MAQATAILQGLRPGIKNPDDFSRVAATRSDCSSAKRGGDLGSFPRGKMQVREKAGTGVGAGCRGGYTILNGYVVSMD